MSQQITLAEHQEIALQILIYLDQICRKYNLKYFVSDGTLLGTIRHQGFIPWDDDVDIWMPREDYQKLALIVNQKECSCFRLLNSENTSGYLWAYSKLVHTGTSLKEYRPGAIDTGIFVDVFPYDGIPPRDSARFSLHWNLILFLYKNGEIASCSYSDLFGDRKSLSGYLKWLLRKLYGQKRIFRTVDFLCRLYPVEASDSVMCLCAGYHKNAVVPKSLIDTLIELPFEGRPVKVPIGYDAYLRIMYGDYMTPPPVEKQVPNASHQADICWKT